jgi:hypothetical protein
VKIIDNVLVFTYVQGDKFFVGDGFGFDVFSSVSVLECVNCFFELTA